MGGRRTFTLHRKATDVGARSAAQHRRDRDRLSNHADFREVATYAALAAADVKSS